MISLILFLYFHILHFLRRRLNVKNDKRRTERSQAPATMDNLPNELLIKIFTPLNPIDLIRIEGVNKRWQRLSKSLWQHVKNVYILQYEMDTVTFGTSPSEMGGRRVKIRTIQYRIIRSILSRCGAHAHYLLLRGDGLGDKILNSYVMSIITDLCRNLLYIDLYYMDYVGTGAIASFLKANRNIKRLTIVDESVDLYFQYLAKPESLEELKISSPEPETAYYWKNDTLRHAESLRKLELQFARMKTLELLSWMPKLENLEIHVLVIEEDSFDTPLLIQPFRNLKALTVPYGIPEDVLQTLCLNCPNLEYLKFHVLISEETLEIIFTLPKLKKLDISGQEVVTDVILEQIPHNITELSLNCCQNITQDGIISLIRRMPNLSILSISSSRGIDRVLEEVRTLTETWINKKTFLIGTSGPDRQCLYFNGVSCSTISLLGHPSYGTIVLPPNSPISLPL